MRKLLIAGLVVSCLQSWCQDLNKVDSLNMLLQGDVDQQTVADIYNELAFTFVNVDSAKAHAYAQQAIEASKSIDYAKGEITALVQIGWTIFRSGAYQQALANFQKAQIRAVESEYLQGEAEAQHGIGTVLCDKGAFESAQEALEKARQINLSIGYEKGLALTYNQLGILAAYKGDYRHTIDYFLQALDIQIRRGDEEKIAGNYNNLAIAYEQLNEQEKALGYYQKALALNKKLHNKRGIAINYNNITSIYRELDRHEEAFEYIQEALAINKEINNKRGISNNLFSLGLYYQHQGNLSDAIDYLNQSLTISDEMGDPSASSSAIRQIGEVHLLKNNPQAAIPFLTRAKNISTEVGNADLYHASLGSLSSAYSMLGDFKKAYEYQVLFKEMTDSLINDENNEKIAKLEAEFDFKKQRDSLEWLQANERAAFESTLSASKNRQSITYIGLGVLFCLAIIITLLYRSKQKANQQLSQLNEQIIEQRDNLQKLNKTKTRLFSIISHDIRGPMSVFIGFADILIDYIKNRYDAKNDQELEKIGTHMRQASGRLLELMDDMVSWAQKEEGAVPYHPKLIKAKELIEETYAAIVPLAQAKDISVIIDVDEGLTVWADKNSFKTILRNLVSNAIKFTPDEGVVTVSTLGSNGEAKIAISDTGIGIPNDKLDQLFELTKSKVRRGTNGEKGTGLGLNVVHEFVIMNKGSISVQSEEKKGTTFTIALPRAEA